IAWWVLLTPLLLLGGTVAAELATVPLSRERMRRPVRWGMRILLLGGGLFLLLKGHAALAGIRIASGTNALTVALILGIMALPTIVSVAEDALQAVGRELREGSFALGATRAETLVKIVIPAAGSGIL